MPTAPGSPPCWTDSEPGFSIARKRASPMLAAAVWNGRSRQCQVFSLIEKEVRDAFGRSVLALFGASPFFLPSGVVWIGHPFLFFRGLYA